MISAEKVSKQFEGFKALDGVSVKINEGNVFGLIGTNGAGKSTFLKIVSGILKPDQGTVHIDGLEVYENILAKRLFFYISDDQYFFSNSTPKDIRNYYNHIYSGYDICRFDELLKQFELEQNRKIHTFSKGMMKQLSIICAICANTKYILCDETFDGLDPVMRQAVKSIFVKEISERNMTAVIASHNLREMEDICDHIGLLHKGGVILSKDLLDIKEGVHRVQCVFENSLESKEIFPNMELLKAEQRGNLYTFTIRGTNDEITKCLKHTKTLYSEVLPLTLEELFICETEVVGYDIKKLIL